MISSVHFHTFLRNQYGRDISLSVLSHYDLVTLKIGSEGGLHANWKTNQYNSTMELGWAT